VRVASITEAHAHRWRVVAFERDTQLVAYRCECGAEQFSRPSRVEDVRSDRMVRREDATERGIPHEENRHAPTE
jgi:hypothetical protein